MRDVLLCVQSHDRGPKLPNRYRSNALWETGIEYCSKCSFLCSFYFLWFEFLSHEISRTPACSFDRFSWPMKFCTCAMWSTMSFFQQLTLPCCYSNMHPVTHFTFHMESLQFHSFHEHILIIISIRPCRSSAVRRWLPTAAARVRVQAACGVCGVQSGTGVGFLQVLLFPLPIIPPISPLS
jgi:hypothetical protein